MGSLFCIRGRIDALAQSTFNNQATKYSCVDFIEPSGRRVRVFNLVVSAAGSTCMGIGAEGEFFFDKIAGAGGIAKHLYAARLSNGNNFFDNANVRLGVGLRHLLCGLPLLLLFFIGVPFLLLGIVQVLKSFPIQFEKRSLYYGDASHRGAVSSQPVLEI